MGAIIEYEHVSVMEFAEQTVDGVEVTDERGEGFSARSGSCVDKVSIDDESELQRVHAEMLCAV
jgi:hypothetical protein